MRFSPINLLLFVLMGCGSGTQPANEVETQAQKQDVETTVEDNQLPRVAETSPAV
jgi:hypothetical protein